MKDNKKDFATLHFFEKNSLLRNVQAETPKP
jgi:hypothetical protein